LPAQEGQQKAKEHAPIRVAWAQNGPKKFKCLILWRARQESNLYSAKLTPNSATLGAKSQQDTVSKTN